MAVEFVVEDGSGKSDSTSYMSVEDFRQFWENRGKDYNDTLYPDAKVQAFLNNATAWIGYTYRFEGVLFLETQALDFPRNHIYDKNEIDVSLTVPKEIEYATAYLGEYELKGKSLNDVQVLGVKSKKIGPVSLSFDSITAAGSVQIRAAHGLLTPYIREKAVRRRL